MAFHGGPRSGTLAREEQAVDTHLIHNIIFIIDTAIIATKGAMETLFFFVFSRGEAVATVGVAPTRGPALTCFAASPYPEEELHHNQWQTAWNFVADLWTAWPTRL